MVKKDWFILSLAITFIFFLDGMQQIFAQETDTEEFTLEEITVTAEKRTANVQDLPSSVVALSGEDLVTLGKVTTEEILESVPNLTYRYGGGPNPDGDIAVRGIQRSRQSGGGVELVLPATTAVYVDGVYQGIGGRYDINRVEVLRGPQGTLYGRSATGGVVAFYTNDPKLGEFSGNVSAELGSYALKNLQGAVNVPAGEKVALRAAARYYSRDGYFDAEGGQTETKEGRLKVLFQPTDALEIVASGSMEETVNWGGGWSAVALGPDGIDYHYARTEPASFPIQKYSQIGLNANYDLGDSNITYIAGYHDYEYIGYGPVEARGDEANMGTEDFPSDWYHIQELRWASDTEGTISWLVGANLFQQEFENERIRYMVYNHADPGVPAGAEPAPRYIRATKGDFWNYGFFTEETFKLRDDFRITAGLRYDKTDYTQSMTYMENANYTAMRSPLNPPIWQTGSMKDDKHVWDNITYKLRFDHDLTPENMLYFTTATGFLPGYAAVSPDLAPGGIIRGWNIKVLDQQELTSYELGTKNQFLNNHLRLNAAAFYYDLKGYPENFSISDLPGPAVWITISSPLEVIGVEMELEYLLTMYDKISFNGGYVSPKLKGWPDEITWTSGTVTPGYYAAMLEEQPGISQFQATLAYDHIFSLADGSTLIAQAELDYTGDYYLTQMNYTQVDAGAKPYNHQDAYTLCNAGLRWTSASQRYSVNGWVRNAFDEEYKTEIGISPQTLVLKQFPVTPGDPRTFGVMVSLNF